MIAPNDPQATGASQVGTLAALAAVCLGLLLFNGDHAGPKHDNRHARHDAKRNLQLGQHERASINRTAK